MKVYLTLSVFIFLCTSTFGQVDDDTIRKYVLEKGIIDSTYIFGKWSKDGQTETHLTYLGEVKTADGRTFKIINSYWVWGLSHRATSRILIFNERNQYVGNYYVDITSLPYKIEDGYLLFQNTDSKHCDKNNITKINLNTGLPKMIFITCTGKLGDSYFFE